MQRVVKDGFKRELEGDKLTGWKPQNWEEGQQFGKAVGVRMGELEKE